MTHDYERNGTTSLFAALEVVSGKVHGRCYRQHRYLEVGAFLQSLARSYPRREVHLICDNYGTHKHPTVRQWLAAHPRLHIHFTPTRASWLNLVERWFGVISQQDIHRGSFDRIAELERAITRFLDNWNLQAKPFVWTKTATQIKLSIRNTKLISEVSHQVAILAAFSVCSQ